MTTFQLVLIVSSSIIGWTLISVLILIIGGIVMSAISDFAAKVKAHQDKEDAAIAGLTGDVANLKAQITALQNSAGAITPEDQALLDGIESRASTIADKLDALDSLTPPVAPQP